MTSGSSVAPTSAHQLIQYTSSPLLAFLDGCGSSSELELGGDFQSSPTSVQAEPPTDILEASPAPSSSAMVRLEPLTEAEASQTSLFYLCELPPASPLLDAV